MPKKNTKKKQVIGKTYIASDCFFELPRTSSKKTIFQKLKAFFKV